MDLSRLSDDDLAALAKGDMTKVSDEGLQHITENPSFGQKILHGVGAVAKAIDAYTGAPMRAGIGAAQNADSISDIPGSALKAAIHQIGNNPDEAPTGRDIVEKAGVPHYMSAGLGIGMDLAANPLNFTGPATAALKAGANATGLARAGEAVSDLAGGLAAKGAHMVTGAPTKAIETYATRGGEVKGLLDQFGGEMVPIADQMKDKVLSSIAATKQQQGAIIESALANSDKSVPVNSIIDKLNAARAKINPHYNPGDIAQIDDMKNAILSTAQDGQMPLRDLFDTKKYLQTMGQSSYVKNGELFTTGAEASKAAKGAGGVARELLHEASPEIAHADSVFEHLHDLDDKMSASLLGQGKAEAVFASAGGGNGNVHQTMLRQVGEATGTNPLSDAELLYAAKHLKPGDGVGARTAILRGLLDAKRGAGNAYQAVSSVMPSGIPTGISEASGGLSDLLNQSSSPYRAAASDNAVTRRLKSGR